MYRNHPILRIALFASVALLALSIFAWIEAVRLPDYANYWEWQDGWHVGVRNAGTLDHPVWWETYAFIGQFPDRGARPTSTVAMHVSPYRFDLKALEVRLLWPVALSLVAPLIWLGRRLLGIKLLPYDYCLQCNYDLTGTLMADRAECPECGASVHNWQIHKWRRKHRST